MNRKNILALISFTGQTIANSYGMLFFSNRKGFAAVVMFVSFFNPYTGIAGLAATATAALTAWFMGFSREQVSSGLYTYSALLMGLGMGTFYAFSTGFWVLLVIASVLALLLSAALIAKLGKSSLPALSLAFIGSLWVVILSAREFGAIGLTQRNIYWLNEMYATGGTDLIRIVQWVETLPMAPQVAGFFRSVSAILFQSNIAAGIILTLALFLYSRIAISLMVAGYTVAILFIQLMDGYAGAVNYYNLGTNFMLVSLALGGFYIIPSPRSYFWSLLTVPISYILVIALWKVTNTWGLPVFSLPFCITVILFIYVLQLRNAGGKLVLTPVQYYSPEENLYRYLNNRDRLYTQYFFRLFLPFMGEWTVSQGYQGRYTHKGDWAAALDFMIRDQEGKTWQGNGTTPGDFYCYGKPVLCPADAVVEDVVNYVDDNPVGGDNPAQNWGNTIVLRHSTGLYSQLSHLKKGSIKVAKGDFVKRGDLLAACGNSGRSPEPHLHFQVQATPYIGSRTLAYPLSYFMEHSNREGRYPQPQFRTFTVPEEDTLLSNLVTDPVLQQAFDFKPGLRITATAGSLTEEWEVMVSPLNELYFWCRQHQARAYFLNDGTQFFFTHFFGNRRSLLYSFYQAAYKVVLSTQTGIRVSDTFPEGADGYTSLQWLKDLLAPFFVVNRRRYTATAAITSGTQRTIHAEMIRTTGSPIRNYTVLITNNRLYGIQVVSGNRTKEILCNYSA